MARGAALCSEVPTAHGGAQVLKAACWYAVLAPSGSEQATLLNLTAQDRRLDDLPLHKELLTSFLTKEVPPAPLVPVDFSRRRWPDPSGVHVLRR